MRFSRVLKSKTKQSINTLQEILKINRLSTNELSGNLNSISYSKIFKGSTLEVPFSLGRTIRGVAFEEYELDPVSFCLSRQDMYNFDKEMFAKDFNNICVSENNKQVKDFISNVNKKDILDFPVWAIAFPWEDNSFYNLKKNYLQLLIKNRKDYTKSSIVGENNKILDLPFALSHGAQYKNLISKITTEGFNKNYPRPGIYILINQKKWRWIMAGNGNHRAYTMSALRFPSLPVSIIKVIDRSKSSQWNNVLNGEYTKRGAEEIFDIVFRGITRIRGCY